MPWLELSLTLQADQQTQVESALEDLGALSVTLLDAQDHPIFEPAPGETPVWPSIALSALFEAGTDRNGLLHALTDLLPELAPEEIGFREIGDQDWTRVWMDQYQPMRFGKRLWIYPSNSEPPVDSNSVIVRLDPGLAFGTGTHPTTALCLEFLDGLALAGASVIDYGCGSGILAIAAIKLGAAQVIAIDNDPQALDASRDNAQRNNIVDKLELFTPEQFGVRSADVLIANILAAPLYDLAPRFADCVRAGGYIALSGILRGQEGELLERYAVWFGALKVSMREDWVRIDGIRHHE
jgi:ribosomal protein L11 methyltransferase